ncbi:uncharacterized protein MYCFIDRAFT_195995 [Pseudocercospora fijiensis CIRAD86]|uniref:Peptidase S59 domain-containing protein n=1 Tax=Pseudocercospora fijiensis (strain CIRAD86) TaxID=383855 RepID=M3B742_PSEFD|nr:uncharacterized protein MYCFIDRAFT_195995 [Pseudocercospora fijiensis CIRAD86]EME85148.1 hypothetical protein MYCFIDRAFT_195995 [Pseudocercospora fijiensis CIRAD86]
MSFGGGFGSSNTGGGFGFGANNNTSSTFGNTASSGTGLFGSTTTSGGFGSGGAFGNTATTSSGGGLFGSGTSTAGGFGSGGFGSTNNNNTSTSFGQSNTTGGGLFGNKTGGFGSTNTGGSIFGGGNNATSGGFGSNNTSQPQQGGLFGTSNTGGFGSTNNTTSGGFTGFGASNTAATNNNGTAGTPFQAFSEKDGTNNQTSQYQSITFQQPYLNKSFEELRTEDYLQGRRYGNSNGQAGSFGQTTGFGGSVFGNTNNTNTNTSGGGLFGANASTTNTATGFGGGFGANNATNNTTGGFGASTGGGLFGSQQNKPAGGLFGNTASSATTTGGFATTAPASGGLFGSNNNPQSTGFGSTNTGGGLFGSNNQTQNKPAFGGFGQSTTNTTGGFGASTNTGGGLFGNTSNTNANTGGGLFGSNNQQQTQQNQGGGLFGSSTNTGGGLFGNNQNKPATGGLFGNNTATNTNTGGGLFGSNNNQQQNTGGGLFGSNTNTNTGGGLFGNNNQQQNKPGGLFGSSTTNTNIGGGLFGSSTQQNNTGGSLFGGGTSNTNTGGSSLFGGNQQQNKPGGLFGSTASNTNTGGSLFGGAQNSQQGSTGLFGSTNQNQNNSLFGSTSQNTAQQQPNQLHASLTLSPYGNDQLFSSLGQSAAPVGPLATPLAGARPAPSRTPSLLSSTRLNSPIYTPRASMLGRQNTYGFSYSNFGTPNSSFSSSLTPQASSLLKPTNSLGSALTSRLAKSMSMQNLRGIDTPTREGGSLLRPTPGSASSRFLETGSMRKLKIDRSLRQDLFAPLEQRQDISPPLHKKVSFDNSAANAKQSDAQPSAANALVRTETDDDDVSPAATRSQQRPNGTHVEMQQVNGASLTDIPEDAEPQRPASAPGTKRPVEKTAPKVPEAGEYWSKPSLKSLKAMSRSQLAHLGQFEVGRYGIGKIQFSKADLSNTDLDQLYGGIVKLEKNSATVYPTEEDTPPRGQGLNVPSKIWLENSWPRSHNGQKVVLKEGTPAYEKHIRRFKKITGTKFDRYEPDTGTWVFDVDHFTTYELGEDDDDDEMEITQQDSSGLSDAPPTLGQPQDDTMQSIETANGAGLGGDDIDDTFEFKHTTRSRSSFPESQIPGGFDAFDDQHVTYDYDDPSADEHVEDQYMMAGGLGQEDDVFAGQGGAVQAPSPGAYERQQSSMASDDHRPNDIAESLQDEKEPEPMIPGSFGAEGPPKPFRSILKPATAFPSPEKLANDDWEDQLQRTMSPRKRDRQHLKNLQQSLLKADRDDIHNSPFKRSMLGQSQLGQSYLAQKSAKKAGSGASTFAGKPSQLGKSPAFANSMDIMTSLWETEKAGKRTGVSGFETAHSKKPRISTSDKPDENDSEFRRTMKPHFGTETLVYKVPAATPQVDSPLGTMAKPLISQPYEVRFTGFRSRQRNDAFDLESDVTTPLVYQRDCTGGVGHSTTRFSINYSPPAFEPLGSKQNKVDVLEAFIWKTAMHLWDDVKNIAADLIDGMTASDIDSYADRLRKDAFCQFWADEMVHGIERQLSAASKEEKALLLLTTHDVEGAADVLLEAKNYRLAMQVAQLPGTDDSRALMQGQIDEWRKRNDWSEMSDPIRALYSILAGETCTVQGKNGPREDRCAEFSIGERFGLSWKQCFALRLLYGGQSDLKDAVRSYVDDLATGREKVQPIPDWASDDDAANGRESVVLGLLRIFSGVAMRPADLEAILDPKTVSGNALYSRLSWQLAVILDVRGIATLPGDKLDHLTAGFAGELELTGEFITAIWVLKHLLGEESRKIAIGEVLYRNGGKISDPTPPGDDEEYDEDYFVSSFRILSEELKVSESDLWSSKAQYARAVLGDARLQAEYLIKARNTGQAQQVISTIIGPRAVIEEDYEELIVVIQALENSGILGASDQRSVPVYAAFVELMSMTPAERRSEGRELLTYLKASFPQFKQSDGGGPWSSSYAKSLEESVACVEMERVLREEFRASGIDASKWDPNAKAKDGNGKATNDDEMQGVQSNSNSNSTGDLWTRYQQAMGTVA